MASDKAAAEHQVCLWLTPKIFPDFSDPLPQVREFFDHYAEWTTTADQVVVVFCTGNGDHILNYRGLRNVQDSFDWARYNCYGGEHADAMAHNLNWLQRVREGGERSYNPYCAGPMFILSEQVMTYRVLQRIYAALREEADRRGIELRLLEYLEPGPEFCRSEWKTHRHPEGAPGSADAGGTIATGVIDVCSSLHADERAYAAYPQGIEEGLCTGDFVAAQTASFTRDMELDGVFLGNQFGLLGFWHPDNAPEPTPERRAGITRFFDGLREQMGDRLIYWMDSYWPAEVEDERWAMSPENYRRLDAVMVSNFAVLVERTQIIPNLKSRLRIRDQHGGPKVLFSFDFVDPWYTYRVHLDDRKNFEYQHQVYRQYGDRCDGVTFFANDTFGHYVTRPPLAETHAVVTGTLDHRTT
ncbi:hypothetical protein [Streptomyces phaeochromogenes]|uniref:hypothetical protein n=1 Tax=Streptomyces phaeochromogenes TaxID=1923 RepID=UPI002DDBC04B|nr:hypothetical protein [Streptomyces phaeochromogenes]WRZ34665.1 hypothetical protein OG931_46500 [Streptomyces phaeochromogenes]